LELDGDDQPEARVPAVRAIHRKIAKGHRQGLRPVGERAHEAAYDVREKDQEGGNPSGQATAAFRREETEHVAPQIRRPDVAKPYHDGAYGERRATRGKAWSCCRNMDEHSLGRHEHLFDEKRTLYD
jgi:hypothetical protein